MFRNWAVRLVVVSLVATTGAPSARAYVPARDEQTGKLVRWQKREIVLTPSAPGASGSVAAGVLAKELARAAAAWTTNVGCTQLRLRVEPPSTRAIAARRDGINAVIVHEDVWCRSGERSRLHCYDPDEQAMTTTYLARDEKSGDVWIEEADIEINAVHYRWRGSGASAPGALALSDLFLHELGHVVGLAHDCDDGFLHASSTDHAGRKPFDCSSPQGRRLAAMAPDPPPPGVALTLASDEKLAVCELYGPTAQRPASNASTCGCRTVGRPRPGHRPAVALLPLLILATILRRLACASDGARPRSTLWLRSLRSTRGGLA